MKVQLVYTLGYILNKAKESNHKAQMFEAQFQVQNIDSNTLLLVSTCTYQALHLVSLFSFQKKKPRSQICT